MATEHRTESLLQSTALSHPYRVAVRNPTHGVQSTVRYWVTPTGSLGHSYWVATEHGTVQSPVLQRMAFRRLLLQSTTGAHHTHLAAVILDAAMERTMPKSYSATRTETWFKNLQRELIDVTFVPLTRCALARRSERPPGKEPRTGAVWPTTIESISQCVADYHQAANAAKHDECDGIVDNICAYAHTLCIRTNDPHELVKLLHQWIENRSINMALTASLNNAEAQLGYWKRVNPEDERHWNAARDIALMENAIEIVQRNGDELRRCVLFLPDISN